MNLNKNKAIDLMIEDLHTAHPKIRSIAKKEGCESDLEMIKHQLLDYLQSLRNEK